MPPITSEYLFFSEDGLMWFSTSRGLTSFDGTDLQYHSTVEESGQMGLNRTGVMIEDQSHNFYLGTRNGLYHYDRWQRKYRTLEYHFPNRAGAPPISFAALAWGRNGKLYAGSESRGLFVYDTASGKWAHHNLDPQKPEDWEDRRMNSVISFAPHSTDSDKLWIGSLQGIYLFDKPTATLTHPFHISNLQPHRYFKVPADPQMIDVTRMVVNDDSLIWFNSWAGGLAVYHTRTGEADLVFGRDALYKSKDLYYGYIIPKFVRLDPDRFLLGVYNGKTAVYNHRTGQATYFNISGEDFAEEETRFLTLDHSGNIWALQRGLLYTSVPQSRMLQQVRVPNYTAFSFSKAKLKGVYFDTASQNFFCAFQGSTGIHVYDTGFRQRRIIPSSIIDNYYNFGSTVDTKISRDGHGRLWVAGWKLHVCIPGSAAFLMVEKQYPQLAWLGREDLVYDLAATGTGDMLFKARNGRIYLLRHATLSVDTITFPQTARPDVQIKDAADWLDNKRNYLYLSWNGGIGQYNLGNRNFRVISPAALFGKLTGFQGVCQHSLDQQGRIWFMLPKFGIRIIDPETLTCIDSIRFGERGLFRGDYTVIRNGDEQLMLFRSQNGIVVYNYLAGQSFQFDRTNGLSSPDDKSFLATRGWLFVSHSGEFEYFHLPQLGDYSNHILPYLNAVTADSLTLFPQSAAGNAARPLQLANDQNTLSFSFSALEFLFPERIEYAYQLAPLEEVWHYTNYFNRKIIYSNLRPGRYTFRLKAQMQGGNWENPPVEYTVVITPAWWQRKAVQVLFALFIAGLIAYLINRRIRFVRKTEKLRSRLEKDLLEMEARALRAQMNPHFIFNSLNSIKSLINKGANLQAAEYLTTFSKLIRTLFQNSDKREISLHEEIETCKLYTELEKMRFGGKVDFSFVVDATLDLKDIRVPALILQPFIENAIWHGLVSREEGGSVNISVSRQNGFVECHIDDDGIGREMAALQKAQYEETHQSRGIGLTQSRMNLDRVLNDREGSIRVIDKKSEDGRALGTTVILQFKET